tara:strand:- start:788 stop:1039 length:252 start_codon:yes stop_codon:yes gene_type:complete
MISTNIAIILYIFLLLQYAVYHILCLKRSQIINKSTRSRDVKLAMTKCNEHHIACIYLTPVWPISLVKDFYDVAKESLTKKEK